MADQSYNDVLRNRLAAIQQQGQEATQFSKAQQAQKEAADAANQQEQYNNSLRQSLATPVSLGQSGGGKGDFNSFLNSIMQQESGGNARAVNRSSGALGLFQIMPRNLPQWSREALGHSVSSQQFLASPEIQRRVASYKLQQYYDMYGPAGAAVAWYSGPGNARRYVANGGAGYNRRQAGGNPSVNQYVQQVLTRQGIY